MLPFRLALVRIQKISIWKYLVIKTIDDESLYTIKLYY